MIHFILKIHLHETCRITYPMACLKKMNFLLSIYTITYIFHYIDYNNKTNCLQYLTIIVVFSILLSLIRNQQFQNDKKIKINLLPCTCNSSTFARQYCTNDEYTQ